MSTLTILHAEKTDTGNYTCHPTQLEVASVMLHVLECEYHSVKKSRAKMPKPMPFWREQRRELFCPKVKEVPKGPGGKKNHTFQNI